MKTTHCTPCSGDASPLSEAELAQALSELPKWELIKEGKAIERRYRFKNFLLAWKFVEQIARIAEDQNHHPDIKFGWGYCTIEWSTHAINGIHQNDISMAKYTDDVWSSVASD